VIGSRGETGPGRVVCLGRGNGGRASHSLRMAARLGNVRESCHRGDHAMLKAIRIFWRGEFGSPPFTFERAAPIRAVVAPCTGSICRRCKPRALPDRSVRAATAVSAPLRSRPGSLPLVLGSRQQGCLWGVTSRAACRGQRGCRAVRDLFPWTGL